MAGGRLYVRGWHSCLHAFPSGLTAYAWDIRLFESDTSVTTTFRDLGVLPEICDALERAGITTPFAIQEMTLSVALLGTDLIGQARTGTGKTLAFGIPVLQRSVAPNDPAYADLPAGKPQALIVAPTRELALQVSSDLHLASKDRGLRVLTIYGGVGYEPQLEALEAGVDIVVGMPGRLLDLANRKALDLGHVHALVLDEADEMLDLGFLPDVERMLRMTPETRQTMLFSATMPPRIAGMVRRYLREPRRIELSRAESTNGHSAHPLDGNGEWGLSFETIFAQRIQAHQLRTDQVADAIALLVGLTEPEAESLTKANKTALKKIFDCLPK